LVSSQPTHSYPLERRECLSKAVLNDDWADIDDDDDVVDREGREGSRQGRRHVPRPQNVDISDDDKSDTVTNSVVDSDAS
jgi:hypothetical protein